MPTKSKPATPKGTARNAPRTAAPAKTAPKAAAPRTTPPPAPPAPPEQAPSDDDTMRPDPPLDQSVAPPLADASRLTKPLPDVTVVILTYNRPDELYTTMQALRANLYYPKELLHFVIADDSSEAGLYDDLKADPLFEGVKWAVNDTNVGWGATVNRVLGGVESANGLVYFQEDDYVLTKPLDLRVGAALLTEKPHVGMLRYRGTAGDTPVFHQFEADIAAYMEKDWRESPGSLVGGKLTYLQFDGGSPTAYLYSNGPHLRRASFTAFYGTYSEGRKLGDTEEEYAIRVKGRMQQRPNDAPGIAILPEWIALWFDHIGQSYQLTEADRGLHPGEEPPAVDPSAPPSVQQPPALIETPMPDSGPVSL